MLCCLLYLGETKDDKLCRSYRCHADLYDQSSVQHVIEGHRETETDFYIKSRFRFRSCQRTQTPELGDVIFNHRAHFGPGIRIIGFKNKTEDGELDGFFHGDE